MSTPFIPPAPKKQPEEYVHVETPVEEVYSDESGLPPVHEVPAFKTDMAAQGFPFGEAGTNGLPVMPMSIQPKAPNIKRMALVSAFWLLVAFAANDLFTAWMVHFFK